MPGGLIGALGQFFHQQFGRPPAPKPQSSQESTQAQMPEFQQRSVPTLQDPIVANLNQQLAQEQPQPVPTEAEQLKQEQHRAWGNYDFERCIVIFSRLHELEPNDPTWPDKLKTSYFNRGKQYEAQGNERRAIQLYYSALAVDPNFPPAKEAAERLLQQEGEAAA